MATTTVDAAELGDQVQELIRRVEAGEEILVARKGAAVVRMSSVETRKRERSVEFGWLQGKVELLEGWDGPLSDEELKDWYGEEE